MKVRAVIEVADALLEAITEAGAAGIPSGHLYAHLCGRMSLEQYQWVIGILVKAGRITDNGHLLKAVWRNNISE